MNALQFYIVTFSFIAYVFDFCDKIKHLNHRHSSVIKTVKLCRIMLNVN